MNYHITRCIYTELCLLLLPIILGLIRVEFHNKSSEIKPRLEDMTKLDKRYKILVEL